MGISFFKKKRFSPFERRFPYLLLWNVSDGTGWKILRGAWNLRGTRDTKIQVIEVSVSSLYISLLCGCIEWDAENPDIYPNIDIILVFIHELVVQKLNLQALKYRSVTDIVRPIREIVRRRKKTTGHSVRCKWNWGLLFVRPECICVRPNCSFVQRKSKCTLAQD
jgi:hypothetical protein